MMSTSSLFLAARGPRTRDQVIVRWGQNPAVVSDPGLLLPHVFEVPRVEPDIDIGFLPHGVDKQDIAEMFPDEFIITNYEGFDMLMNGILRCRQIVSSSLHGMIFAHSLGKPVTLINVADRLTGGDFKFVDYLCSIGLYDLQPRQPLQHLDTSSPAAIAASVLETAQNRLTSSFPFLPENL
jgi:hypothetical protein